MEESRCLFVLTIIVCVVGNVYSIFDDEVHSNRSEVFYIRDDGRFGTVRKEVPGIEHMECKFNWLANQMHQDEIVSETWIMRMTYTHDYKHLHCEVETFGDKVTSKIPIFYFRFAVTGLSIKKVVGRRSNQGRNGEPLTDKEYKINSDGDSVLNDRKGYLGRLTFLAVTSEANEGTTHDEL